MYINSTHVAPYVTCVGKVCCDVIARSIYSLSTLLLMPILSFASLSEQRRRKKANEEARCHSGWIFSLARDSQIPCNYAYIWKLRALHLVEHLLWNSGYWPSPNKSARVFAISYAVTKRKRMVKLFIYDYLYFIQAMLAILRIYLFPIRPRLFHSAFTFTMRSGWLKQSPLRSKGYRHMISMSLF